jgi:flagellar biosynthesis protein FlhB
MLPTVAAAAAVAAAQWGLARLRFEKRIRMTPQEFQEEMKGMEADPKVRLRREQGSRSHTAR